MWERLFPKTVDNRYRGHPLALWVFVPITLVTLGRSLVHVFRADGGAQSIATIPLDSYSEAAATTVVVIFALWGLQQLLVGFVYVAVLLRYRALLPFMYLLLLLEYAGRLGLGLWKGPLDTASTPPGARFTVTMILVASAMLLLSLRDRSRNAGLVSDGATTANQART
jgi:hypothetical protein